MRHYNRLPEVAFKFAVNQTTVDAQDPVAYDWIQFKEPTRPK